MAKHLIDILVVFVMIFLPIINTYLLCKILTNQSREEGSK